MDVMPVVNDVLRDDITKINSTLVPPGFQGDFQAVRRMQENLSRIIDVVGEQSTRAQGLTKIITSANKLRITPGHTLYILKDARARSGKGEVIGILKIGSKHLYLFDESSKVRQVEPLCVLDFFVLDERQRKGYGRMLFDYMLKDQNVNAHELAIDGPSPKLEQFMRKNYGFDRLIKQNNNFAVSQHFFAVHAAGAVSGRTTPTSQVGTPSVGRFTAHQPRSDIANIIHGGGAHNGVRSSRDKEMVEASPTQVEAPVEPERQQEPSPERPNTLTLETLTLTLQEAPPTHEAPPSQTPPAAGASLSRRDSQVTEKGFFDVKFYHNKLW